MNGRELEGMTLFDLSILHIQILRALTACINQRLEPVEEQKAWLRGEVKISVYYMFLVSSVSESLLLFTHFLSLFATPTRNQSLG